MQLLQTAGVHFYTVSLPSLSPQPLEIGDTIHTLLPTEIIFLITSFPPTGPTLCIFSACGSPCHFSPQTALKPIMPDFPCNLNYDLITTLDIFLIGEPCSWSHYIRNIDFRVTQAWLSILTLLLQSCVTLRIFQNLQDSVSRVKNEYSCPYFPGLLLT